MKVIPALKITKVIADLCVQANLFLRKDVLAALNKAYRLEKNRRAKRLLGAVIENARVAKKEKLAICQDTGMPIVFLEIGQDVRITGSFKDAVNRGVELGYRKASLRNSIIREPLARGKSGYSPAVTHIDIVKGNKIKITVLSKGFGCENKSQVKMFNPTTKPDEIKEFIIDVIKAAGPDACPPYVVGVGIGGTADYACLLAKKALLRKLGAEQSGMERELLRRINALNIGPMGLGGKATCLGVHIETFPTHIAGLPVAVNISCHALRSATAII